MNTDLLKQRASEAGLSGETVAKELSIDASTYYRKLNNGDAFTVGQAKKLKELLHLNTEEAVHIFFN